MKECCIMTKLLFNQNSFSEIVTTFGEMYACNVKEARNNLRFSVQLSFALWETLLDIFKGNANYTIYKCMAEGENVRFACVFHIYCAMFFCVFFFL